MRPTYYAIGSPRPAARSAVHRRMWSRFPLLMLAAALWPAHAMAQMGPVVASNPQVPLAPDPMVDSWDTSPPPEPQEAVYFIKPEIVDLMIRYLDRSQEDDARRLAANVLDDAARRGCTEAKRAAPQLMRIVGDPATTEFVRQVALRALASMEHREATPIFLAIAKEGSADLALLADEALAAWKVDAAKEAWRSRVGDASTDQVRRLSAITSLGQVRDAEAIDVLRGVVSSEAATPSHRIAAARSLALITGKGLEPLAESLARRAAEAAAAPRRTDASANPGIAQPPVLRETLNAALAAIVLSKHDSPEARKLQVTLSQHREPSVAVEALAPLVAAAPSLVKPFVDTLSKNDDAVVREMAARALIAHKTRESVAVLGPMIGDPNPTLRRFVRDALIKLHGDAELAASVRQQATEQLSSARWQNREQAALLAGRINHQAAGKRLLELFCGDPRYEVRLASIAAIRWMNLTDLSEPIFAQAKKLREEMIRVAREPVQPQFYRPDEPRRPLVSVQFEADLCQAMQTLGVFRYTKADDFMKAFVPRDPKLPFTKSRAAAIWAYGFFHEKDSTNVLIPQLIARIREFVPTDPSASEDSLVRAAALLTLGRMHAEKELRGLVRWLSSEAGPGDSIEPALAIIYGPKPVPPAETPQIQIGAHFAQSFSKPAPPPKPSSK